MTLPVSLQGTASRATWDQMTAQPTCRAFCSRDPGLHATFEEVAAAGRESERAHGPQAASAPEPLDAGLQRHFESIQSISDSTTLPQALRDLQRHVARLTGVHQLLDLLRCEVVSLIIGSSAEDVKMSSSGAHQEHYTAKYV